MPSIRVATSLEHAMQLASQGDLETAAAWLVRRGGLPGPKPNWRLAQDAAEALAQGGEALSDARTFFLAQTPTLAPESTSAVFLPVVGVLSLGVDASRSHSGPGLRSALDTLHPFAEDPRRHVREAVTLALEAVIRAEPDVSLDALAGWMDGYLQADAVIGALGSTEVVRDMKTSSVVMARLDDAFELAASANRAHQRSHGFRSLLRSLPRSIAKVGKRFPQEVTRWLEQKASAKAPHMREVVDAALAQLRRSGLRRGDAEAVENAIAASTPAPRDPRSYVGPTRERGTKARRRGKGGV